MKQHLTPEEIALKITGVYFEEIARRGEKRKLDFDAMINTYFFVLEKVKKQEEMVSSMMNKVMHEEEKILHQSKEEIIPAMQELKEKIPEKH